MTRSSHLITLIILVSCAHALVHLLEQSVASVEQVISTEFELSLSGSGALGFALRLPYGIGAFFAGLLADRFGEKRILLIYLAGSAIVTMSFLGSSGADVIYLQLFALGTFASMYHPAGLALLANQTTPTERARALGLHGVFGSLGIAAAPFLAGFMLSVRPGAWRGYYLVLSVVCAVLSVLVWRRLKPASPDVASAPPIATGGAPDSRRSLDARAYVLLVIGAALGGTVYSGVLHFLPRYLREAGTFDGTSVDPAAIGNYAAALALVCGAAGQFVAGRLARPRTLPLMLSIVYAANIPFLCWMAVATGKMRLLAACLWAFFHFMNQPVYNSLLPEYLPTRRRSVGFGFSNLMGFGVGAIGPPLIAGVAERSESYTWGYFCLAGLAAIAALLPLPLYFSASRKARQPD